MLVVISGPGGVGKGTVVRQLLARDPRLRLSRSWTTRARRPGEPADAYTFVDRPTFEAHAQAGGFFEYAEFVGNLYGTPVPDDIEIAAVDAPDLVLEIDVQGAEQVLAHDPSALFLFLVAPSPEVQEARLHGRGDPPPKVAERLAVSRDEIAAGERLGGRFVVNDDLDRTVTELCDLIDAARAS